VLPFEADSDSTAENRSCINFLNACRGFWAESVELVGFVDVAELAEVEFELQFGGEGIEIPIWLNASMMLCINVSCPPEFDCPPETRVPDPAPLLFDCWGIER
jgi:hypothetical protein